MIGQISWKEILAVIVLLLAFVFFRSEKHELSSIGPQLKDSRLGWILAGILLVFIYIVLQGLIYVTSFRSVRLDVKLSDAVSLFKGTGRAWYFAIILGLLQLLQRHWITKRPSQIKKISILLLSSYTSY